MSRAREERTGSGAKRLGRRFADAASPKASTRNATSRPFSIRLSNDERQTLEHAAGSTPLGTYVRALILDGKPRRARMRRVAPDTAALGRLLALLGASRLGSSLSGLAAAARLGTIQMTPELETQVRSACADVQDIRTTLMRALGLTGKVLP